MLQGVQKNMIIWVFWKNGFNWACELVQTLANTWCEKYNNGLLDLQPFESCLQFKYLTICPFYRFIKPIATNIL